jgi:hypothetical protein
MSSSQDKLQGAKWKFFPLTSIFSVSYGNKFDLNKMTLENPSVNFVSRTGGNNGVSAVVDEIEGKQPYEAGNITVALGGSIGSSFVQQKPFYTGQNVAVLKPKKVLTQSESLFVCSQIMNECHKRFIAFGRELNIHIKRDFGIGLIVDQDGNPDWPLMAEIIESVPHKTPTSQIAATEDDLQLRWKDFFDTSKWRFFKVGKVFTCLASKNTNADVLDDGEVPYVSRTALNNSIAEFVDPDKLEPYPENCISIGCESAFAAYQEEPFLTGNKIYRLYNKHLNKYNALFVCTIINNDKYKWSYGRGFFLDKVKEDEIKLPEKNGEPDWEAMENFIKSMPFSDCV